VDVSGRGEDTVQVEQERSLVCESRWCAPVRRRHVLPSGDGVVDVLPDESRTAPGPVFRRAAPVWKEFTQSFDVEGSPL